MIRAIRPLLGQRDLRRLLITRAMAVVQRAIWRGETSGPWFSRDAGTQAEDAGRGGARQQDGAGGLGAHHEKAGLPGSCCRLTSQKEGRESG